MKREENQAQLFSGTLNIFHLFQIVGIFTWNFTYQRKKGSQHAKNALIIIPNVRAAFFSRLILLMAHGSTWCILCRWTAMPLICKCFSNNNAATFDLKIILNETNYFFFFNCCVPNMILVGNWIGYELVVVGSCQ